VTPEQRSRTIVELQPPVVGSVASYVTRWPGMSDPTALLQPPTSDITTTSVTNVRPQLKTSIWYSAVWPVGMRADDVPLFASCQASVVFALRTYIFAARHPEGLASRAGIFGVVADVVVVARELVVVAWLLGDGWTDVGNAREVVRKLDGVVTEDGGIEVTSVDVELVDGELVDVDESVSGGDGVTTVVGKVDGAPFDDVEEGGVRMAFEMMTTCGQPGGLNASTVAHDLVITTFPSVVSMPELSVYVRPNPSGALSLIWHALPDRRSVNTVDSPSNSAT
jgi:hypothetical protein